MFSIQFERQYLQRQTPYCNEWFKEGKYVTAKDEMQAYCPSMCGFCKFDHLSLLMLFKFY